MNRDGLSVVPCSAYMEEMRGLGKQLWLILTYTRAVHEECCKIALVEKSMKLLPCKDWILRLGLQGTAVCSVRVRRTPTDARALLTRKTQEIQKIHSATMHACSGMRNRSTVIFYIYSTCTSFSRVAGPRDCRDRNARSCSNAKGLERPLSSGLPPESRQDVSRALLCMQ